MKNFIVLLFFLLAVSTLAEEQTSGKKDSSTEDLTAKEIGQVTEEPVAVTGEPEADTADVRASETDTSGTVTSEPVASEVATVDPTKAGSLKNRKLSQAIEQFIPTETISADNAVPFPIDI